LEGPRSRDALAFGAFVALHLVAAFLAPDWIWGACHLRFAPPAAQIAWAVLLGAISLAAATRPGVAAVSRVAARVDGVARARPRATAAAGLAVALAAFVLLRARHRLWGDGLLVASLVANPAERGAERAGHLAIQLHKLVLSGLRVIAPDAGGEAAFAAVSCAAGVAVLALAVVAARQIAGARNTMLDAGDASEAAALRRAQFLVFASIAGSGGIALFFGHVEEYPVVQLAILAYLVSGIAYLRERAASRRAWPLVAASVALAAAVLLHLSALALVPTWSALFLLGGRPRPRAAALASLALVAAAGAWRFSVLLNVAARSYGGASALVPLVDRDASNAYTFFSAPHALFLGNELLLILGGALLLPLMRADAARQPAPPDSRPATGRFLAITSACALFATALVDHKFGPRDWDLAALSLFPLLLWIAHATLAGRPAPGARATLLLAGAMLLHLLPIVGVDADRARAGDMAIAIVARDPHYSRPGFQGYRLLSFLLDVTSEFDNAIRASERQAAITPSFTNYRNLGILLTRTGHHEKAIVWLRLALQQNPNDWQTHRAMGYSADALGQLRLAEYHHRELVRLNPAEPDSYVQLGSTLIKLENADEGLPLLEKACELGPDDADAWRAVAAGYRSVGWTEKERAASARADSLAHADSLATAGAAPSTVRMR
jgi:Tetratricopeptide repeat